MKRRLFNAAAVVSLVLCLTDAALIQLPIWTMLLPAATAVWWLGTLRPWIRGRRRQLAGQCISCGYDLRGSAGACPECGAEREVEAA
jgi:hypothetical protein